MGFKKSFMTNYNAPVEENGQKTKLRGINACCQRHLINNKQETQELKKIFLIYFNAQTYLFVDHKKLKRW